VLLLRAVGQRLFGQRAFARSSAIQVGKT